MSDSDQNLYQIDQDQALLDGNCANAIITVTNLPQIGAPSGRLAWDGEFLWTASAAEGMFYKIDVCTVEDSGSDGGGVCFISAINGN